MTINQKQLFHRLTSELELAICYKNVSFSAQILASIGGKQLYGSDYG